MNLYVDLIKFTTETLAGIPMKQRVKEVYTQIAKSYDQRYSGICSDLFRYEVSLFNKIIDPNDGDRILDLGAGTGRFAAEVLAKDIFYVGIDLSKTMIKISKQKYSTAKNVEFMVTDAEYLPFRPSSFDKAVSIGMFEYITRPRKTLSEIRYVLKDGGRICMNVWNKFGVFCLVLILFSSLPRARNFRRSAFRSKKFRHFLEDSGFRIHWLHGYCFIPPSIFKITLLNRLFPSYLIPKLDQNRLLRNVTSLLFFSASKQ